MQQQLSANLTIPVPEDYILISKVELQELEQQQLTGTWWTRIHYVYFPVLKGS